MKRDVGEEQHLWSSKPSPGELRFQKTSCPSVCILKRERGGKKRNILCSRFFLTEDDHSCFLLHPLNSSEKHRKVCNIPSGSIQISLPNFLRFSFVFLHDPAQQKVLSWMLYSGARLLCSKGGSMLGWELRPKSDPGWLVFLFPCLSHHSVTLPPPPQLV